MEVIHFLRLFFITGFAALILILTDAIPYIYRKAKAHLGR